MTCTLLAWLERGQRWLSSLIAAPERLQLTGTRARRRVRPVTLGILVLAVVAMPARLYAANPTGSIADLALPSAGYSHSTQLSTGTMELAIDSSTNADGWHVTVLSSAFVHSGTHAGNDIAAVNFSITSADAPVMTSGQAIDATGGPKVPSVSPVGTLDTARKTVQADAGFGQGTYTQALGVSLSIPAQSRAGTYTGTLTVTAALGP